MIVYEKVDERWKAAVGEKLQPDDHHEKPTLVQNHDDKDLKRDVLGVCGTCLE